ncbi:MAG: ATP-dependent DNA helicase RecG [Lactobacillales bacterium]|jgi:ATP-dependent DNA helicase RecG|nr:ATP-dependent DNA helicase RecG [Lactobacillales bacterium]
MKSLNIKDNIVGTVKGVGPKKAKILASLGIHTIEDLLLYYPFRYEKFLLKNVFDLIDQDKVALKGVVVTQAVVQYYAHNRSRLSFQIVVMNLVVKVVFFNQPYLSKRIFTGRELVIYGKWDEKRKILVGIKILDAVTKNEDFLPVYHVNKKIRQTELVKYIKAAFTLGYGELLKENLPFYLRQKYRLIKRSVAIYSMHFPKNKEDYRQALRRLKFEEFFSFQIQIQSLRQKKKEIVEDATIFYDETKIKKFVNSLPFTLTKAQNRVSCEILQDMKNSNSMLRLLQGDVGSGKTAVAAIAIVAAISACKQSALMVPTEVLAKQHFESLLSFFASLDVYVALLTGSIAEKDKRATIDDLASGKLDVVIGTHALLKRDVQFNNLGLVIMDEQHRFGVNQRKILREKAACPNTLLMSATPIPRTLALTIYAKMDVSVIDEKPKGRFPVQTRWMHHAQFSAVLNWLEKILKQKQQIYFISPLIEESEVMDLKNATELAKELTKYFAKRAKVALLHGKMKNEEKEEIMSAFKQRKVDILVSTTVIEVGVNIPNATVMVIMDADRFGLSQLHQLRGRVGRSDKCSYAFLIADPKTKQGVKRMQIITEIDDGFALSEKDLEMRGAGEIFGVKQSGVPEFVVGDVISDFNILKVARDEAAYVWQVPNWWEKEEFLELAQNIEISDNYKI